MRLSDLSPLQIRMMARLAGYFAPEDATGIEISELTERDWRVVKDLAGMGLIALLPGWRMTVWLTLTERGRTVRREGIG